MLERTQRRQELLASTLSQVSQSVLPPSSTTMETSPTIQQSLSPPFRRQRRTRLAELASQVDQWLSDDQNFKQNENISNPTVNISKVMIVNYKCCTDALSSHCYYIYNNFIDIIIFSFVYCKTNVTSNVK